MVSPLAAKSVADKVVVEIAFAIIVANVVSNNQDILFSSGGSLPHGSSPSSVSPTFSNEIGRAHV